LSLKVLCTVLFFVYCTACAPLPAPQAQTTSKASTETPAPGQPEGSQIAGTAVSVAATEPATAIPSITPSPTIANAPDLRGEQIPLIHLCDRTGPFSGTHANRITAVEDAIAAINASGGIFGAELDLYFADTSNSPQAATAAYARALRQAGEGPIMLVCDPAAELTIAELASQDEIPVLSPGVFVEDDGFLFGVDATPEEHFTFFLQDLIANWNERKPEGAGTEIRVALLTWPADIAGEPATEQALAYAAELGVEIVLQSEIEIDPEFNIFDVVYELRDENANVVFTTARGESLAGFLNALSDLGLRDRFVLGGPAAIYSAELYDTLAVPAYSENVYLTSPYAWWSETDNPSIQLASDLISGNTEVDWGYLQMVAAVDLARHALQVAIIEDSFADLSSETVADALESLEDFQPMAGLFSVNYGDGNRSVRLLRTLVVGAEAGALSPVSDYAEVPDLILEPTD
jgi:ABC-type branched-subunit amino acid transport system substrate-binding protein